MILALDFCGSAFTGIQWVLYNPGGLRVNTSLRFFFFLVLCVLFYQLLV